MQANGKHPYRSPSRSGAGRDWEKVSVQPKTLFRDAGEVPFILARRIVAGLTAGAVKG